MNSIPQNKLPVTEELDPKNLLARQPNELSDLLIQELSQETFKLFKQEDLLAFAAKLEKSKKEFTSVIKERKALSLRVLLLALERLSERETIEVSCKQWLALSLFASERRDDTLSSKLSRQVKLKEDESEKKVLREISSLVGFKNQKGHFTNDELKYVAQRVYENETLLSKLLTESKRDELNFLFECGVNPNGKYDAKWLLTHALNKAIKSYTPETLAVIDVFLHHGASLTCQDEQDKKSPLLSVIHAKGKSSNDLFKYLVSKGVDLTHVQNNGRPLVFETLYCVSDSKAEVAINALIDLSIVDERGLTLFFASLCVPQREKVPKLLLDKGIDILTPDPEGKTPWSYVLSGRNDRLIQKFLTHPSIGDVVLDVDIEEVDTLSFAMSSISLKHLKVLTSKIPYDPNRHYRVFEKLVDLFTNAPQQEPLQKAYREKFEVLLKWTGGQIVPTEKGCGNLFVKALEKGQVWVVKELMERGVSPLQKSSTSASALHYLVGMEPSIREYVLERFSQLDQEALRKATEDSLGNTPLHYLLEKVADNGESEELLQMCVWLLERGLNPLKRKSDGKAPIELFGKLAVKAPSCLQEIKRYLEELFKDTSRVTASFSKEDLLVYGAFFEHNLWFVPSGFPAHFNKVLIEMLEVAIPPVPARDRLVNNITRNTLGQNLLYVHLIKGTLLSVVDQMYQKTEGHIPLHPEWLDGEKKIISSILPPSWMTSQHITNDVERETLINGWHLFVQRMQAAGSTQELLLKEKQDCETYYYIQKVPYTSIAYWIGVKAEMALLAPRETYPTGYEQLEKARELFVTLPIEPAKQIYLGEDDQGNRLYKTKEELFSDFVERMVQGDFTQILALLEKITQELATSSSDRALNRIFDRQLKELQQRLEDKRGREHELEIVKKLLDLSRSEELLFEEMDKEISLIKKRLEKEDLSSYLDKVYRILHAAAEKKVNEEQITACLSDFALSLTACVKRTKDDILSHYATLFPVDKPEVKTASGWLFDKLHGFRLELLGELVKKYNEYLGNETHTEAHFLQILRVKWGLFTQKVAENDVYGVQVNPTELSKEFSALYEPNNMSKYIAARMNEDKKMHAKFTEVFQKELEKHGKTEEVMSLFDEEGAFVQAAAVLLLSHFNVIKQR